MTISYCLNIFATVEFLNKINSFLDWCKVQIRLEHTKSNPPSVKEGEIWWVYLGQNLGSEIYGKGEDFTRPVIILKKYSRYTFLVIPCSTKIKEGSWYSTFVHKNIKMIAVLFQSRTVDYSRLRNKIGELDTNDFCKIKSDYISLIK